MRHPSRQTPFHLLLVVLLLILIHLVYRYKHLQFPLFHPYSCIECAGFYWRIVSVLLLANSAFASTSNSPDDIVGVWKTGEGTAMVRIYKNGDKYQGKVVWLKEPIDPETGKPKVDKNHPDEASRKRAVLGLINIWGS